LLVGCVANEKSAGGCVSVSEAEEPNRRTDAELQKAMQHILRLSDADTLSTRPLCISYSGNTTYADTLDLMKLNETSHIYEEIESGKVICKSSFASEILRRAASTDVCMCSYICISV
jgi:hypothetical protein